MYIEGTPNPETGEILLSVPVYTYDPATMEYLGESLAYIDQEELKQGLIQYPLPANTTPIRPVDRAERQVSVWRPDRGEWEAVADWRGVMFWLGTHSYIINKRAVVPPSEAVFIEPPVIKNNERRTRLLEEASTRIAILLDARVLGIITEAETLELEAWKVYRVELCRMTDLANESPAWPTKPEN